MKVKNLKNKIMLAILAGNMLCMGSAWADYIRWYGDKNNPTQWKSYTGSSFNPTDACLSGADLTLDENTVVNGKHVGDVFCFYGGYSSQHNADILNNTIIIQGGTATGGIYAGYISSGYGSTGSGGIVKNNCVIINGGNLSSVQGGYSNSGIHIVTENTVIMNDGVLTGGITAGIGSNSCIITKNTVEMKGGKVDSVTGGYGTMYCSVSENKVIVSAGTVVNRVSGGESTNPIEISNNTVLISGGSVNFVYGAKTYGMASGNSVTISGGATGDVYGGHGKTAFDNNVEISGGMIGEVYGGYSDTKNGDVMRNSLLISGGTTGNVYGGSASTDVGTSGIVQSNSVTINDGSISGNVYGGYSSSNDATDNIVTIEGGSFGNYGIYGGRSTTNSSGNIFNLKTRLSGLKEVGYFQKINFTLPSDVANGDTIVSAEKFYVDTKGGRVEFTVSASDSISLKKGDIITLIDSADTNNSDVYVDNDSVLDGTAKVYRENGESKNSDGDTNDIILEMLDDLIILEPEVPTSDFLADSDISNIAQAVDGKLQEFIDNVSETFGDDTKMATNAVNTMASANILAGTQHAAVSVTNHITNSIYNSVDVVNRPKLSSKNDKAKLRNVDMEGEQPQCETIELGQTENLMPVKEEIKEYDKQVWASIVHSKEKIEGMKTGSLEQDSTVQYNGTTAGADLWSSNKGFGGVALTYADGNVESSQKTGNIRNDADYYGVSVYHRQDIGNIDIVSDISYTHTDNDITTDIAGNEITARPKVDVYSAGTKIEAELRLSKASKLVPYLGARYSRLQNKDFTNSLGGRFDVDNANLFTVPVGLALRSHLKTSEGWDFGSILEGGYEWNLGDRDSTQKFSYGGAYDIIGFDIVDSGQYYIKAALTAAYQNLLFELLYRYSKGKTTRDNNWRLNVNWGF